MVLNECQCRNIVIGLTHRYGVFPNWDVEGVNAAVNNMSPKYQKFLELKYVKGMKLKEIAAEVGVTDACVVRNLNRCYEMLVRNGALVTRELTEDSPIAKLNLGNLAYNSLTRYGIETIHDVLALTPNDFKWIRGFGIVSAKEVKNKLKSYGFNWDINVEEKTNHKQTVIEPTRLNNPTVGDLMNVLNQLPKDTAVSINCYNYIDVLLSDNSELLTLRAGR